MKYIDIHVLVVSVLWLGIYSFGLRLPLLGIALAAVTAQFMLLTRYLSKPVQLKHLFWSEGMVAVLCLLTWLGTRS